MPLQTKKLFDVTYISAKYFGESPKVISVLSTSIGNAIKKANNILKRTDKTFYRTARVDKAEFMGEIFS